MMHGQQNIKPQGISFLFVDGKNALNNLHILPELTSWQEVV
jgi:hypothetical protein